MALGVTQQLPEEEEKHIYKKEYIADSIVVALGGRMAEEIVFGHLSTGAQNDLVRITELARKMVREWGMAAESGRWRGVRKGRCSWVRISCTPAITPTRPPTSSTRRSSASSVRRRARARRILRLHGRGSGRALARALLEHETLDGDDVSRIVDYAMGAQGGRVPEGETGRRERHGDEAAGRERASDPEGSGPLTPRLAVPEDSITPRVGSGVDPGSRTSASRGPQVGGGT